VNYDKSPCICYRCTIGFKNKRGIIPTKKRNLIYNCAICNKYKCDTFDALMIHRIYMHNDPSIQKIDTLNNIPRIHKMRYTCIICKCDFSTEFELHAHKHDNNC